MKIHTHAHSALLAAKGNEIVGLNCYKMRPIIIIIIIIIITTIIVENSKCEIIVCSEHGQLLAHRHVWQF
jgi:hypothetical protein